VAIERRVETGNCISRLTIGDSAQKDKTGARKQKQERSYRTTQTKESDKTQNIREWGFAGRARNRREGWERNTVENKSRSQKSLT
jgi:hypothetical protein